MTMMSMLRAAIMVFGIGSSGAHADNGDVHAATTLFASIPGEQSSPPAAVPGRVAIAIPNGAVARGYMTTTNRHGNWLFLPAPAGGKH
jgi:hypothetical protein